MKFASRKFGHVAFLERCWPAATARSRLLRDADVRVYSAGEVDAEARAAIAKAYPGRDVAIDAVANPGKLLGAMLPLARAEAAGWFDGYDWVIRLNPDVIIRDDGPIAALLARRDLDGVFVDCNRHVNNRAPARLNPFGRVSQVHSDFTAFRPAALPRGAFRVPDQYSPERCFRGMARHKDHACNPEWALTDSLRPIIRSGRYALLRTSPRDGCRVNGFYSSVLHEHEYIYRCERELATGNSTGPP